MNGIFFALKKKKKSDKNLYFFENRVCTYSHLAQGYLARKTIGIMTRGPKLAVYRLIYPAVICNAVV